MLGVPVAMPEARCLLLLGYNHAAPSGMGCSFSKGLTPPAVPQVPGAGPLRAGCSHPAPRSRFTARLCHPFLPSSEHLRSACCGQADGLPSGGQAPFGKSGSPREVRIPWGSQDPLQVPAAVLQTRPQQSRAGSSTVRLPGPLHTQPPARQVLCALLATLAG